MRSQRRRAVDGERRDGLVGIGRCWIGQRDAVADRPIQRARGMDSRVGAAVGVGDRRHDGLIVGERVIARQRQRVGRAVVAGGDVRARGRSRQDVAGLRVGYRDRDLRECGAVRIGNGGHACKKGMRAAALDRVGAGRAQAVRSAGQRRQGVEDRAVIADFRIAAVHRREDRRGRHIGIVGVEHELVDAAGAAGAGGRIGSEIERLANRIERERPVFDALAGINHAGQRDLGRGAAGGRDIPKVRGAAMCRIERFEIDDALGRIEHAADDPVAAEIGGKLRGGGCQKRRRKRGSIEVDDIDAVGGRISRKRRGRGILEILILGGEIELVVGQIERELVHVRDGSAAGLRQNIIFRVDHVAVEDVRYVGMRGRVLNVAVRRIVSQPDDAGVGRSVAPDAEIDVMAARIDRDGVYFIVGGIEIQGLDDRATGDVAHLERCRAGTAIGRLTDAKKQPGRRVEPDVAVKVIRTGVRIDDGDSLAVAVGIVAGGAVGA